MLIPAAAWAQGAGAEGPSVLMQIFPIVLIFVVMYFLLIRPQQQKAREHREMLKNLKRNDEVITAGGLYGRIVQLSDRIVTLEIAPNVRVRVDRPQIAALASAAPEGEGRDRDKDKQK